MSIDNSGTTSIFKKANIYRVYKEKENKMSSEDNTESHIKPSSLDGTVSIKVPSGTPETLPPDGLRRMPSTVGSVGVFLTSLRSHSETRQAPNGREPAAETSSSSEEEEEEVQVTERRRHRRIANKPRQTLEKWVDGPVINSDEYDTDLEEDFPPGKSMITPLTLISMYSITQQFFPG